MLIKTHGLDGGGPVPVTYEVGAGQWVLLQDYRATDARMGATLVIRQGFRFDMSSVPRLLWWRIGPHELSVVAPLCHDALYRYGGRSGEYLTIVPDMEYSRRDADKLFEHHMESEGVPGYRVQIAYRAVRWFGGGSWQG